MNIKSLLIGSAAALVAVSGARAADAIVAAEPEPVEYVRVCDAFGTGYFYIPGTETCLKIGGYVRYQVNFGENVDEWDDQTMFRLEVSSWTDSELGPVSTYIRLDAKYDDVGYYSDGTGQFVYVNRAHLTVGGLNLGKNGSLYDFSETGAADDWRSCCCRCRCVR